MKIALPLVFAISLACSNAQDFKALKRPQPKHTEFIQQLTAITLKEVFVEQQHLSEAITTICKRGADDSKVANFVVLFPTKRIDANPFSEQREERARINPLVSFKGQNKSFSFVLDSLCHQAGYEWSIAKDGNDEPFIQIEYKTPSNH